MMQVTTPDGDVLIGKVVAVDESLDIAAVQVNCVSLLLKLIFLTYRVLKISFKI